MPNSDSIVADADFPQRAFVCSHANVGLDAAWVEVAGELDIATTPRLERTLREAQSQARLVVLDLRDVPFMDCSGVHVSVGAGRRARDVGRRLILLRGPPNLDSMFTLTGHTDEVEIADVARASRGFRRSGKAPTRGVPYDCRRRSAGLPDRPWIRRRLAK
jgi:anti-sigma B factor antagonist